MKTRAYMSFGGGVQSTAIALLAINRDARLLKVTGGVLPDLYIFADTGDEPRALYPHIERIGNMIRDSGARFQVVETPLGRLSDHVVHALNHGHARIETPPFYVGMEGGRLGPIQRHCTRHFKILPITAYARHYFGVYRAKTHDGARVQMWLGISHDEPQRVKSGLVPKQPWCEYFNPLYEMCWTRSDCVAYLEGLGIEAQRSACTFCPFRSRAEWRKIRAVPEDWAVAVAVDEALERAHANGGAFNFENPLFLNREGKRLRDVDLAEPQDAQQNLWDNECAGVCGV